jgi:hypothetical protein
MMDITENTSVQQEQTDSERMCKNRKLGVNLIRLTAQPVHTFEYPRQEDMKLISKFNPSRLAWVRPTLHPETTLTIRLCGESHRGG